ncbi:MAG TPA: hypothetical protein DCG90_13375 [Sphingobium sp.]|uniref:hypothetical protein n=1 Tax=Sphingobium sp. TaxID=1912891 RepID=UPI000EDE9643|nr:hypothetical protein [Sphingobium sp.]HAF42733.1 hypothetical protein [Sphingobium sp.]
MGKLFLTAWLLITVVASPAWSQATTRQCSTDEAVGPACLLAHSPLPSLPDSPVFWHIDRLSSRAAAERVATASSTVVEAFGSIWLFTIEQADWKPGSGERVSTIGPLSIEKSTAYAAEYLRSIFPPGTTAPLHVHSGPEAFFAVSGDTCLETPDGVQIGRGPSNALMIRAGPPMLLMAIGNEPRRGFALILHDASKPPTTLTNDWKPVGLCARQFATDQRGRH